MGFLAPAFLIGALAVALPLYLHLLHRNTSVPLPFSSLMFFESRQQEATRRRRLRYWLLLALRLAVILLLVLAFANPYLKRTLAGNAPEKLVLIAVDNSFSMRTGTRLQDARREALAVLAQKRPRDRAQVLQVGARIHLLTQPTSDLRSLRAAIESIQPGDSRASFGILASVVRSIAQNEPVPVELHLFSDLQKTDMPPNFADMALPSSVSLMLHASATGVVPNWTVESVSAPRHVWDPRTAQIEAVIAGYGTPAATRVVSFVVNGATIATRRVEVPASGRATAQISSLDLPYGFSRCSVTIDGADALPADDMAVFTVERAERKRGLFVYQAADARSALYFDTALGSAAQNSVVLDKVTVDKVAAVDPAAYAFVVISDVTALPAEFSARITRFVQRGGNVLLALGSAAAQAHELPILGGVVLPPHYYSREPERFAAVGQTDSASPIAGSAEEWEGARFYYAAAVAEGGARVLLRLQDRTPLLLERPVGEGRVIVFASGFDNLTNDLPLRPTFVAFVERLVHDLAGDNAERGPRTVDDVVQLRSTKERGVAVEVNDPTGVRALSLQEAVSAQTYQPDKPGFYDVRFANGRRDLLAVNPDPRESDLAPMSDEVLALWRGSSSSAAAAGALSAATVETQVIPRSLWWYAVLALLLVALAEAIFGRRYLGTLRSEP